jgi:dienelactone hydrolase
MNRVRAWCSFAAVAGALGVMWVAMSPALAAAGEKVAIASFNDRLQLDGYWFPARDPSRRPVVISLHGCNGALDDKGTLSPVWRRDAGYFNDEGMHFLVLDSFTPRGVRSICETRPTARRVNESDRRDDVYAAIRWLAARPDVDPNRIAVVGRSHGGSTVLAIVDRTDKAVQAQPIKPRAAIALYPGCAPYLRMLNYEAAVPTIVLAGELDDWTPSADCVRLVDKARDGVPMEIVVYPGSHHGFDSPGPVTVREDVATTRSGRATVGGNPEARRRAHERMFEFLSRQLDVPLVLSHEQRFAGHRLPIPAATSFAIVSDVSAVPLSAAGRARYEHWLTLPSPRAFAITERGGWYFAAGDREAMQASLEYCKRAGTLCWLYAVDERVVWHDSVERRIDAARLDGERKR